MECESEVDEICSRIARYGDFRAGQLIVVDEDMCGTDVRDGCPWNGYVRIAVST